VHPSLPAHQHQHIPPSVNTHLGVVQVQLVVLAARHDIVPGRVDAAHGALVRRVREGALDLGAAGLVAVVVRGVWVALTFVLGCDVLVGGEQGPAAAEGNNKVTHYEDDSVECCRQPLHAARRYRRLAAAGLRAAAAAAAACRYCCRPACRQPLVRTSKPPGTV
jgi:hypothetical protein